MSYNESRAAVLDQVFWKSEANSASVAEAETVPSPDPQHDHMGVRVSILSNRIGPMPPLEALCTPVRLTLRRNCKLVCKIGYNSEFKKLQKNSSRDKNHL